MQLDHILWTVPDLVAGAEAFTAATGLASVDGGAHLGHGTANRIAPVGDAYIELLGVNPADPDATVAPMADYVRSRPTGPALACFATDDLDRVSALLGVPVRTMSRRRPDGVTLAWSLCGLDRALDDGTPFFIRWDLDEPADHPSQSPVDHPVPTAAVAWCELGGPSALLADLLGPTADRASVEIRPGATPGVGRVGLRRVDGSESVVGPDA